jgi:protein-S-isoprenylcysteine O-methyltransferase
MSGYTILLISISAVWVSGEITLGILTRAKSRGRQSQDRHTIALLWATIIVSIFFAAFLTFTGCGLIPLPVWLLWTGLVLVFLGEALRLWAVFALGRFFSSQVAVSEGHRVVESGPFSIVRHPSYLGALLAFLGLGFAFGNLLAVGIIIIPITTAFVIRIYVEERVLRQALGADYTEYCRKRKRLLPGIW